MPYDHTYSDYYEELAYGQFDNTGYTPRRVQWYGNKPKEPELKEKPVPKVAASKTKRQMRIAKALLEDFLI